MIETVELLTLLCLPAFLLLDLLLPGRTRYRASRFWRLRALGVTAFSFWFALVVSEQWGALLGDFTLVDGTRLGTVGGAAVAILLYELAHYGYHRVAHGWEPLWRLHQMHHSAESLDAFGANYIHPLDLAFFTTWATLVFVLLGLTPGAVALGAGFLAFNAVFQHANVKTPRWLGYLIQRPESHHLHHARGYHRSNYADLPLIDMLFGTFENPAQVEGELGYYDGASARLGSMLVGRDVTVTPEDPAEAPTRPYSREDVRELLEAA